MSNNYLNFNGTNQYASISHTETFNIFTSSFSVSFWMKYNGDSPAGDYTIIKKTTAAKSFSIEFFAISSSIVLTLLGMPGFDSFSTVIPVNDYNIHDGNWHHLIFTKESDTIGKIYESSIDINAAINLYSGVPAVSNEADILIGHNENTDTYFNGSLDDFRIYNKALTQTEVNAIYNDGTGTKATGEEDGIIWASNFDTGTGDIIYDVANSNNGTLVGNVADDMWWEGGIGLHNSTLRIYDDNSDLYLSKTFKYDDDSPDFTIEETFDDGDYTAIFSIEGCEDDPSNGEVSSDSFSFTIEDGIVKTVPKTPSFSENDFMQNYDFIFIYFSLLDDSVYYPEELNLYLSSDLENSIASIDTTLSKSYEVLRVCFKVSKSLLSEGENDFKIKSTYGNFSVYSDEFTLDIDKTAPILSDDIVEVDEL